MWRQPKAVGDSGHDGRGEHPGALTRTQGRIPWPTASAKARPLEPVTSTSSDTDPYEGKNPAAVELGRQGGLKGGRARAEKLTAEQRSEIAKRAAAARWSARDQANLATDA
jgi:hypothetical protein